MPACDSDSRKAKPQARPPLSADKKLDAKIIWVHPVAGLREFERARTKAFMD
jgi:hypothetical protein